MNFDPATPYNNLSHLPPGFEITSSKILIASMAAGEALAELNGMLIKRRNIASSQDLLSPLLIPEAVSSSGIENIITTNDQAYRAQVSGFSEQAPIAKEVLNYTAAMRRGFNRLTANNFLATNDFLDMQAILEPKKNGIRKNPGTQLSNPATREVFYTPPVGEPLIRRLLADFEKYFNAASPPHEVFARMALLHYQFEAIHPFLDGNGRTGRMLMPLYLIKQGKLSVPVLFISSFILRNRSEYYRRLRRVTSHQEWEEWVLYILKATEQQAIYTSRVFKRVEVATLNVQNTLSSEKPSMRSAELLDFLFSHVYFTEKMFEEALNISYRTALKYLLRLEELGIIGKSKEPGRNRNLYITPQYIKILKSV